ncbi:MAG TPA: LLM class flavin-dependent oxidoreductase [Mycobacteriales bacterium]|jgi:alkanesulfonate monooxygenase SsuD/methylene tetrahydromethanopterin reductase-like flavin-dependent oxidoreductase (luciferase family)|nr:LLM class flavin-dependent oxidoreductase [Mycobacteriales bacterium]
MKYDIFFSFSRMEIDGYLPSEAEAFGNLVDQIAAADDCGFETAWVGEAHFALREEQRKAVPFLPHFRGELCLNTDILQLAHYVYPRTRRIQLGSAIRNILCNGGPIAHAEAIRTFLTLHGLRGRERRLIQIGFGTGRFQFANAPFGVRPRDAIEEAAWPVVRGMAMREATEIFLRLLRGDAVASADIAPQQLSRSQFRGEEAWRQVLTAGGEEGHQIPPFWTFDRLRLLPEEAPLELLCLTLGSHDPELQRMANRLWPVRVFNLSVTPEEVLEETHRRMQECYHPDGGPWRREYLPRTVMVFVEADPALTSTAQSDKAQARAQAAIRAYWHAMEGTIDEEKVTSGMSNAVFGNPEQVAAEIASRFHPDDRIMAWFDFNDNDSERVIRGIRAFETQVVPLLERNHASS